MKYIKKISHWKTIRNNLLVNKTIGFVPTMGALHKGHISLIEKAKIENDIVVLSIFVNPTQFNDESDFKNYPNKLDSDKSIARKIGVDFIFSPDLKEIYSNGYIFSIHSNLDISKLFEGKHRPGHFTGMLTIVMKLLQTIQPTRIYFGEKDYQQFLLVKQMVEDFFIPVQVVICPTVREASGLPFSSRNINLTKSQKNLVEKAYELIKKVPPKTMKKTRQELGKLGILVEYMDCYENRIFLAIRIGNTRLIDNFTLEKKACSFPC